MNVGDIVVYNGPLSGSCGRQYFYVYRINTLDPWLIQISQNGAGWLLDLPRDTLTKVGRVGRLLTDEEMVLMAWRRVVPDELHDLLQPWLGERPVN